MTDPVTDYALAVLDGAIPAGPFVIWACERHMMDLRRDDIYLDLAAVQLRVNFFKLLRHYKGEFYGRSFELAAWQMFRIGSVFGWKRSETKRRRYRVAYTEIPRKNGKTTEMAGVGLAGMLVDGEPGAEVYAVATKKDQAKIVWGDAKEMIRATPALSSRLRSYQTAIVYAKAAAKFAPLGRDSQTLDGLNPSLGLYDEFHAWRDRELRGKIRQGMGARREPLEWIVTTAGTDSESPCYELREHALNVLDPEQPDFVDDSLFAYIACPFEGDDPGDVATWARANPNLGIGKSVQSIQELWDVAKMMPSELNDFLIYQLNIWTNSAEGWLPLDAWKACGAAPVDAAALVGQRCYAGLDLAQVNDLSALVLVFPDAAPEWQVLSFFWCPQEDIRRRSKLDKVPYDRWARDGYITATPGNATDYAFIEATIREVCARYDVVELLYDRWSAHQMIGNLSAEGINCVGYGQGYKDQSPALKELERRLISKTINHGGHPILRWNASNAQVVRDPAGGIKLSKKDPRKRIDGIAALSNAIGGIILNRPDENGPSIYETQGITIL